MDASKIKKSVVAGCVAMLALLAVSDRASSVPPTNIPAAIKSVTVAVSAQCCPKLCYLFFCCKCTSTCSCPCSDSDCTTIPTICNVGGCSGCCGFFGGRKAALCSAQCM